MKKYLLLPDPISFYELIMVTDARKELKRRIQRSERKKHNRKFKY